MRYDIEKKMASYRGYIDKQISWLGKYERIESSFKSEPNFFYKISWAFSAWGKQRQVSFLLDWSKEKIFDKTWQFVPSISRKDRFPWPTKNTGGDGTMAYMYAYMQIGSQILGRFDVAYNLISTILSYQNETYGGFYGKQFSATQGEMDLMTTAFCGLSCLYSGRLAEAKRAADFIVNMKQRQPNPNEELYVSLGSDGKLITDFAAEDAACYFLDRKKPGQMYIFLGAAIMYLCKAYMVMPSPQLLDGAKFYYDVALSWDDLYESLKTGKVAWGSSCLYKITRIPKYLQTSIKIADHLIESTEARKRDNPALNPTGETASWIAGIIIYLTEILNNVGIVQPDG